MSNHFMSKCLTAQKHFAENARGITSSGTSTKNAEKIKKGNATKTKSSKGKACRKNCCQEKIDRARIAAMLSKNNKSVKSK